MVPSKTHIYPKERAAAGIARSSRSPENEFSAQALIQPRPQSVSEHEAQAARSRTMQGRLSPAMPVKITYRRRAPPPSSTADSCYPGNSRPVGKALLS